MSEDSGHRMNPNKLGIALGLLVVALIVFFIIMFTRNGLPKDPDEWRRLEQQRSASTSP